MTKTGRLACGACGSTDIVAVLTTLVYYAPPDRDVAWPVDGEELDWSLALDVCSDEGEHADGECLDRDFVCRKCGCPTWVVVKESAVETARVTPAATEGNRTWAGGARH